MIQAGQVVLAQLRDANHQQPSETGILRARKYHAVTAADRQLNATAHPFPLGRTHRVYFGPMDDRSLVSCHSTGATQLKPNGASILPP